MSTDQPNKMQKPQGRPLPRGGKPEGQKPKNGEAAKREPGKSGGYQTK